MAGDWIKWSKGLTQKREVVALANKLRISRREMAAVLMEVWSWADGETVDGHAPSVTKAFLDELTGVTGLGAAMAHADVGWLLEDDTGIIFPNFDRHNGSTAKHRLLAAERKRRERQNSPHHVTM